MSWSTFRCIRSHAIAHIMQLGNILPNHFAVSISTAFCGHSCRCYAEKHVHWIKHNERKTFRTNANENKNTIQSLCDQALSHRTEFLNFDSTNLAKANSSYKSGQIKEALESDRKMEAKNETSIIWREKKSRCVCTKTTHRHTVRHDTTAKTATTGTTDTTDTRASRSIHCLSLLLQLLL